MEKLKKNLPSILLGLMFLIGIGLLTYPTIANWWNETYASHAVASYKESVNSLDDSAYEQILKEAKEYNLSLLTNSSRWSPTEEETKEYKTILDVSGTGIMGTIEIPLIRCDLPIYHTTDDTVLQVGIGHMEGSSLPVGGASTHAVLSGHRGLPSAKLFTRLDEVSVGDVFMIHIMDETLTYEVDQINIVEPTNVTGLDIVEGEDLVTLVTCTPYGVNTHRLLVRGHRIPNVESANIQSEAVMIDKLVAAPFLAVPILLVLLVYMIHKYRRAR